MAASKIGFGVHALSNQPFSRMQGLQNRPRGLLAEFGIPRPPRACLFCAYAVLARNSRFRENSADSAILAKFLCLRGPRPKFGIPRGIPRRLNWAPLSPLSPRTGRGIQPSARAPQRLSSSLGLVGSPGSIWVGSNC